jgi:lysozyme
VPVNVKLIEMVKASEGLVLLMRPCPSGYLTIGYGHNLETTPIGVQAAETILLEDLARATAEAKVVCQDFWATLNEPRRAAIIDMAFNLGRTRLLGFKMMLLALSIGDYAAAARHAKNSKWARQVGQRAERNARMIEVGEW